MILDSHHDDSSMVCKRSADCLLFVILILIVQKQAPVIEESPQEGPPSYDYATENGPCGEDSLLLCRIVLTLASSQDVGKQKPDTTPVQPLLIPHPLPESSYTTSSHTTQPLSTPSPMIYNYINPISGEQIVSLLPPNHPEMICLQSGHVPHTRFGLLGQYFLSQLYNTIGPDFSLSGMLAAVLWFPFGIGLCLLDRRVRCHRCGLVIDDGVCG